MKVPYLAIIPEFDREPVRAAVKATLDSGMFVGGPAIERFEARFAKLCGVKHALGLNSGTDALWLALRVLGVGPGDEVITVSNSFVATAGAIVSCGARPVYVDVGPDYLMDPDKLEAAITKKTKAVIPVHLTGQAAEMDRILAIAGKAKLPVIEDSAQAVGAKYKGRPVGSLGRAAAFSLHPLKNLAVAGDGGVLTTDDDGLAERVKRIRNHGLVTRDDAVEFGWNSRLDTIHAAIGEAMLDRQDEIIGKRRANAAQYDRLLGKLAPHLVLPPRPKHLEPVFHTFVVLAEKRDELRKFLEAEGVETKIHYPIPIHLQTAGRAMGGKPGQLPVTEAQAGRLVTLPVHQHLSREQLDYVADRVHAFYKK